jgi:3-oxoacyl-[acyl-carrier-protein] synthase-3
MNGLSVIMQASRKLPGVMQEVLAAENLPAENVGAFVLHQANQNLLLRVAKALGVPAERFYSNIAHYGNTSSASLMIALAEWMAENPKGPAVLAAFGAGFHWGAVTLHHEQD